MTDDLNIFSDARMMRYRKNDSETEQDILNRYLWNIQLSESFYPALSIFEVVLRNRVDEAISSHFGEGWLDENWEYWSHKSPYESRRIREVKLKIKGKCTRNHLIAELNLGFWIGLFRRQYKPIIWNKPTLFETAFPRFDVKQMDRVTVVFEKLEKIRILRNRISHHEPIFDIGGGLDTAYQDLEKTIFWLSPKAQEIVKGISRFNAVFEPLK